MVEPSRPTQNAPQQTTLRKGSASGATVGMMIRNGRHSKLQAERKIQDEEAGWPKSRRSRKALKEQRWKEKCCYTCRSDKHFAADCPENPKRQRNDDNKGTPKSKTLRAAMVRGPTQNFSLTTTINILTAAGKWRTVVALIDSGAELNFI